MPSVTTHLIPLPSASATSSNACYAQSVRCVHVSPASSTHHPKFDTKEPLDSSSSSSCPRSLACPQCFYHPCVAVDIQDSRAVPVLASWALYPPPPLCPPYPLPLRGFLKTHTSATILQSNCRGVFRGPSALLSEASLQPSLAQRCHLRSLSHHVAVCTAPCAVSRSAPRSAMSRASSLQPRLSISRLPVSRAVSGAASRSPVSRADPRSDLSRVCRASSVAPRLSLLSLVSLSLVSLSRPPVSRAMSGAASCAPSVSLSSLSRRPVRLSRSPPLVSASRSPPLSLGLSSRPLVLHLSFSTSRLRLSFSASLSRPLSPVSLSAPRPSLSFSASLSRLSLGAPSPPLGAPSLGPCLALRRFVSRLSRREALCAALSAVSRAAPPCELSPAPRRSVSPLPRRGILCAVSRDARPCAPSPATRDPVSSLQRRAAL